MLQRFLLKNIIKTFGNVMAKNTNKHLLQRKVGEKIHPKTMSKCWRMDTSQNNVLLLENGYIPQQCPNVGEWIHPKTMSLCWRMDTSQNNVLMLENGYIPNYDHMLENGYIPKQCPNIGERIHPETNVLMLENGYIPKL